MAEAHVVTPGGYRHPSLVHRVEAGTVVDRTAGRLRLVHRSGRVLREFGVLQRSREGVPVMPANVVPIPPGDAVTAPVPGLASGWITYSTWTNPDAGNPISRFSTTWVVPPEPSSDDGQTVFLFNGIQNGSMIYQPVLQWGSSGAGGGDNWAVASWYADGQGGPAFHTDLVSVNPGDVLVGVMTLTGQSDLIALQQNVGGVGTSVGPALANFNGLLYMAWKGIEGDDGIWWSTFDGANWAPQQNVGGVGTSVGPALANFNGVLYMAWKGIEGDDGIWWSTFDGANWAPQQNVGGVGTSFRLGLASPDGLLYMAWKGIEGDDGIWWSTFDGANWAPQQNILGVGSSVGPALAAFNGNVELAWKGIEGDDGIWWTTLSPGAGFSYTCEFEGVANTTLVITNQQELTNAVETLECYSMSSCGDYPAAPFVAMGSIELNPQRAKLVWSPVDAATDCGQHTVVVSNSPAGGEVDLYFTSQQNIAGVGTSVGPALAAFNDAVYMAWKGIEGDDGIWWSTFDGANWAPQQNVGGVGTSVGPALTGFDRLYMAWKGIEGDDGIWWSTFDGANWAPQQNVGGVGTSVGPTLAVNEGDQPLLYMAWKGIEGDDGIWWSTFDGANWAPQQNVGGVGTSVGPALASFNGVLYMVWKGIEGDDGIWWSTFDGANWAPQQNIGGVGTSFRPALAVYDAKLYMAWKGIEGDDGIWWSSFDGANWAPQQNVGGVGTSAGLGIAPDFDGFLDMAWKGIEGDDGIWWSRFDGTNWV